MKAIWSDKGEQAMEEERAEKSRRLSRYDRAVFLLQLAGAALHQPENDSVFAQVDNFLAEEPKP